jgi:DNA-binding PadR family transcriptional regulator
MARTIGLAALRVLQAVAQGKEYGFDIIEATRLPSGTVYPALSKHERDGYVRSSWEDAAVAHRDGRPPRRYYRLTPHGRKAIDRALAALGVPAAGRARAARARGESW